MKKLILYLIDFYQQNISANRPPSCNFYPTCSCYAKQAITEHGAIYGSFLSVKRILKCHPFRKFTVDLVPPKKDVK